MDHAADKIDRITPILALAAYERTGLKPTAHVTVDGDCGCPIGAIARDRGIKGDSIDDLARLLGLSDDYNFDFTEAFDDVAKNGSGPFADSAASRDALAVWATVKHLAGR